MTSDTPSPDEPTDTSSGGVSSTVMRLFRQSAVYSLGNLAVKVAGLLLLPLYLDPAFLSQADYGYLGLIETAAQLAIAMTGLGIAGGLLRYGSMAENRDSRDEYVVTAFITTAAAALVTLLVIALLAEPLARILVQDATRSVVVMWTGVYVALKVIGAVPFMLLRVRERPFLYLAALLLEIVVLVAGVWYALSIREAGLEGVMTAFAASAAVSAVPLSVVVLSRARSRWRPALAKRLLRFGMPLTVAALAAILLNTGDRFVLEALAGPEVLAVYVLATKFGGLVNMLFVQSFNMAFAVLGLKALAAASGSDFHRRVFRHFIVLAGWAVLAISVMARDLTAAISPNPAYLDVEPLILPIAFGFLLYGTYYVAINVLYAAERTRQVAGLVLGAAVFNLALNVALVPSMGAMGAALATLAAYGLLLIVSMLQARRAIPINMPWRAFLTTALIVVGLWALAQPSIDWTLGARLAARSGIIVAYPLIVLGSGLYRLDEVRSLFRLASRR